MILLNYNMPEKIVALKKKRINHSFIKDQIPTYLEGS